MPLQRQHSHLPLHQKVRRECCQRWLVQESLQESVAGSVEELAEELAEESVAGSAEESVAGSAEELVAGSVEELVAGSAEELVAGSAEELVAGSVEESAEEWVQGLVPALLRGQVRLTQADLNQSVHHQKCHKRLKLHPRHKSRLTPSNLRCSGLPNSPLSDRNRYCHQ